MQIPSPLTIPTINLNGSPKKVLVQDILDAKVKLEDAIAALRQTSPHPRDYQLAKDGVYGQATREYRARLDKLASVHDELYALAIAIHDSAPDRD